MTTHAQTTVTARKLRACDCHSCKQRNLEDFKAIARNNWSYNELRHLAQVSLNYTK